MSNQTWRTTTTKSWGDRIGAAFSAAAFGLLLVVAGPALQWWNEGRAINMERALKEGAGKLVSGDPARADAQNEGAFLHLTGKFDVQSKAGDPELGFSLQAARLKRSVEMFQWEEERHSETRDKLGGGSVTETTYKYNRVWSSREISSSSFHQPNYTNPGPLPFGAATFESDDVRLGAFKLGETAILRLPGWEPVPADEQVVNAVAPALEKVRSPVKASGNWIFAGRDPADPQIGDFRLRYEAILPKEISIIARQERGALVPHTATNGESLLLVASGRKGAAEMIADAQAQNKALAWALRGVGVLLLFLGMKLIASPISAIAHVIPFLGRAAGFLSGIAAFLLAIGISILTIGIAWLAHRPAVGIPILVGAIALIFWAGSVRARAARGESGAKTA